MDLTPEFREFIRRHEVPRPLVHDLPESLRDVRSLLHWTQEDLAREMGVSARAVGDWETATSAPRDESLLQLTTLYRMAKRIEREREDTRRLQAEVRLRHRIEKAHDLLLESGLLSDKGLAVFSNAVYETELAKAFPGDNEPPAEFVMRMAKVARALLKFLEDK